MPDLARRLAGPVATAALLLPWPSLALVAAGSQPAAEAHAAPGGGAEASLAERLAELYSDGSIQDRLPGQEATAGAATESRTRERVIRKRRIGGSGLAGPIAWTGAAVVIALGLFWLIDAVLQRRRLTQPALAAAGTAVKAVHGRSRQRSDPEALASAGRYSEAAHELLLHAIDRIASRTPRPLSPALTGREIARKSGLETSGRRAFDRLLAASERFLFGGQPLAREDYADCHTAYRELDRSLAAEPVRAHEAER